MPWFGPATSPGTAGGSPQSRVYLAGTPHAPKPAASRPPARQSRLNELPMAMSQPPSDALPAVATRAGWASLKDLTGYQWFVFIVCCLAWDMDCLDQQLFNLARRPAMQDLVP